MSLLLCVTYLLIPIGPAAIVGALVAFASIECPELLPRRRAVAPAASRSTRDRSGGRGGRRLTSIRRAVPVALDVSPPATASQTDGSRRPARLRTGGAVATWA